MKSIVLSFLLTLSGSLVMTGCHSNSQAAPTEALPQAEGDRVLIATNSPQLSSLTVEPLSEAQAPQVSLAGRLVWDEDATVRVFTPFAGIVRKLLVGLNEPVHRGQPLAEIQSPDFGQAHTDARKADSDFRRAERNLTRVKDLFAHGAAPRKDVESAEADFASAEAERDRAHARLAIYGAAAGATDPAFLLPSPLDGVLVERNVTPGQEVRPDQMLANTPQLCAPLFVVTDPKRLWVQIEATEVDLPHLKPGQPFRFASRAFPGKTFIGTIQTVSEFIDPNTRTIKVRGTVDNPERLLKAEMFVNVNLPSEEPGSGATVPAKAVFLQGEQHYVFVEQQRGEFVRKPVQVGAEQDNKVLILAGLEPGERVVTDGCLLLQRALK
jgi:membrane fusion protein, heavy metal efflux system